VSEAYTAWLPPGAFADGAAERRLDGAIEQWAARWFADRTLRRWQSAVAPRQGDDLERYDLDEGLALALNGAARTAVAGAMLDAALDVRKANSADRHLFDRLSAACLEDLRSRLAQAFRLDPQACWQPSDGTAAPPSADARAFAFEDADEPLLLLFVTRDLEVASIKADLRAPPPAPALAPLVTGLAAQRVDLSALLGRCDLTIAELAGLTRGDVLVLDRDLDAPLDLAVDGQVKSGCCEVEQDGDRLNFKIVQTLTG